MRLARRTLVGLAVSTAPGCWVTPEQIALKQLDTAAERCTEGVELLSDPSFEQGTPNPAWVEESLLFETPLCDPVSCTSDVGYHARSGAWWAWFGGVEDVDTSMLTQHVVFNPGPLDLSLWVWVPSAAPDPSDRLSVQVDGASVFEVEGTHGAQYADGYVEIRRNLDHLADGAEHTLTIIGTVQGTAGVSNFFVDDVSLIGCP
jgi:hypothetical protein